MRPPSALHSSLGYGLAFGARHAAALATVALLSRTVSVELFAHYVLLRIGLALGNVLSDLGASTALVRLVADAAVEQKAELVGSYFASRAAFACALVLLGSFGSSRWLAGGVLDDLWLPLLAAYAAWVLSDASGHALRAFERHGRNITGMFIGIVAHLSALLLFVVVWRAGLRGVLWAFAVGDGATLLFAVAVLGGQLGKPRWAHMRSLLRFGAPTGVPRLVRALSALDRHLVAAVSGVAHAAVYQVGAQASAAIAWLESSLYNAVEPRAYATGDDGNWLVRVTSRFATVAFCAAVVLTLLSRELVVVVASEKYARASLLVGPLLIAALQHAVSSVVSLRATQSYAPRIWAYSGGLDLALSVSLMLFALPRYGAEGAAWARSCGACAALGLSLAMTHQRMPARLPVWRLGVAAPALLVGVHAVSREFPSLATRVLFALGCVATLGVWATTQRRRSKNA